MRLLKFKKSQQKLIKALSEDDIEELGYGKLIIVSLMNDKIKRYSKLKRYRGIEIQKVGVKNVEVPLNIQRKNDKKQIIVSAKATMSVFLPKDYKGTHMSRFVEILCEWGQRNLLGDDIKGCLLEVIKKLEAKSAEVKFEFKYFIDKQAPVSKLSSPMGYECCFEGILEK